MCGYVSICLLMPANKLVCLGLCLLVCFGAFLVCALTAATAGWQGADDGANPRTPPPTPGHFPGGCWGGLSSAVLLACLSRVSDCRCLVEFVYQTLPSRVHSPSLRQLAMAALGMHFDGLLVVWQGCMAHCCPCGRTAPACAPSADNQQHCLVG